MRTEGEKKGNRKRREKKRKKEGKMGIKIRVFFFFFFISLCASYAQWSFFKYIKKTLSKFSISYPLLFAIKILMVSQFGDL